MTIFMHAREVSWLSTHGVGGGYIDVIHVYIALDAAGLAKVSRKCHVVSRNAVLLYWDGTVHAGCIHTCTACMRARRRRQRGTSGQLGRR